MSTKMSQLFSELYAICEPFKYFLIFSATIFYKLKANV